MNNKIIPYNWHEQTDTRIFVNVKDAAAKGHDLHC